MTTDIIEPESALVLVEPQRLAQSPTPEGTIELATRMATALRDIVDKQRLYATIQGKKYPQVEAWMTIGRMDNVVAREVTGGVIRLEDGAYEATVELIRLSDGMVTGRGSALCGTKGDRPWDGRPENMRRSMAVTRATSRAFRQQYSWIMALAGYEPTPADEMPDTTPRDVTPTRTDPPPPEQRARDAKREVMDTYMAGDDLTGAQIKPVLDALDKRVRHGEPVESGSDGLVGTVELAKDSPDFLPHMEPDGHILTFKLTSKKGGIKVVAHDPIASALALMREETVGSLVTCWGRIEDVTFRPKGSSKDVTYQQLHLERIRAPEFDLPAALPVEAPSVPIFDEADEAVIDKALSA